MSNYTRKPWNDMKHAKRRGRAIRALMPERQFEANCEWRKCPRCNWKKLFRKDTPETYLEIRPTTILMDNYLTFLVWTRTNQVWHNSMRLIHLAVNKLNPNTLEPEGPNPELRRYHWHPEPPA